ncbi:MAG: peptide-methionine (S)-S-oxide reductase MsrA [Cyanobacteria bacterium]|nr:peptide-methionine (S)-S-oxide reductase MsrA [Cyanobacteriota bacterium]
MNAAINVLLILITGFFLCSLLFRDMSRAQLPAQGNLNKATLAAGCFWRVESELQKIEGVKHATSGYMGGTKKNPSYWDVCTGTTGHAESVQVLYDPKKLTYKELIRRYLNTFKLKRPGGPSEYRSVIFYDGEQQKREATEVLSEAGIDNESGSRLLEPASTFYAAEEFHQDYYKKMSIGSCKMGSCESGSCEK